MSDNPWSGHPTNYRKEEVQHLLSLLRAGECVSLIGLSGMGKSNLLGYLAYRASPREKMGPICILIDCNRLPKFEAEALYQLARHQMQPILESLDALEEGPQGNPFEMLNSSLGTAIAISKKPVTLLLDGFDDLARAVERPFFNQLRSLRDRHKYRLSFLLATRQPLEAITGADKIREFDDLLVSNQIWLNPLSEEDTLWTIKRFQDRMSLSFSKAETQHLLSLSGGHPGLVKALAASWSSGDPSELSSWLKEAAVSRECELLWGDLPEETRDEIYQEPIHDKILQNAGLAKDGKLFSPVFAAFIEKKSGTDLRLVRSTGEVFRGGARISDSLTAKEFALLSFLMDNQDAICEKDMLIRAVWPEDKVYEEGIRDDSLAQLVRRLRIKIEPDPSNPTYIQTIPGRGYRLLQPD